jgi:hypothetical protein
MEIYMYHQREEAITAEDPEYQRLYRDATSVYAAEEIDAWQMACAEGIVATTPIGNPPARQGAGV